MFIKINKKDIQNERYYLINLILDCDLNDEYKKHLYKRLFKLNRKLKDPYCCSISCKTYLKNLCGEKS